MSVPRITYVSCPGCEAFLEVPTCDWSISRGEHEDKGTGLVVQLMGFLQHECWAENE